MRIAIFSDTFAPQVNGVTKTLNKMKEYMNKNEIEYRFFVPGETNQLNPLVNIIEFQSINFFLYPECKIALPRYADVKANLDEFKPEIIHITTQFSMGLIGLKYARDNNIPLVSSYHTDFPAYLKHYNIQFLKKALWRYLQWFHSFSSINFVPSSDTLEQLKENGIKNLEIWGRGIDKPQIKLNFDREKMRSEFCDEGEALLLYVGRLSPEKELEVLLSAVEKLNGEKVRFKLLMVGDGPSRQYMESRNIPNIIYMGYKSGDELYMLYNGADIFVFPSSTETYGNVILEAMISGLPVVAPLAGGIKENLMNMINGVEFQAGNDESMKESIKKLIIDKSLRRNLAENAYKHSLTRNWDSVFDKLFMQYSRVINCEKSSFEAISA